ncbi:MAG: nucleotidyltransferase family protein [Acidobacteriota bacterium]
MFKNHQEKQMLVGGLLLAAGGSTRFGSPKQLAKFHGKTLLRRAAEAICGSGCSPVVVVLGACIDECEKEIEGLDLNVALNVQWQTGMASSIKTGLAKLLDLEPDLDAVMITLMDQPLVTNDHLAQFVEQFRNDRPPAIAAEYKDIAGVPALFSRALFEGIFRLDGDIGARAVIKDQANLSTIRLSEAGVDIDTANNLLEINSD